MLEQEVEAVLHRVLPTFFYFQRTAGELCDAELGTLLKSQPILQHLLATPTRSVLTALLLLAVGAMLPYRYADTKAPTSLNTRWHTPLCRPSHFICLFWHLSYAEVVSSHSMTLAGLTLTCVRQWKLEWVRKKKKELAFSAVSRHQTMRSCLY